MTESCSDHQGQLIIWAAAEAYRLRRHGGGPDPAAPGSLDGTRAIDDKALMPSSSA